MDAGGTSCRAVVMSPDGGHYGCGYASGANPSHMDWKLCGQAIGKAVREACANARESTGQIISFYMGMAGVVTENDYSHALELCREWNLAENCRRGVDHDIRVALEGGLSSRPGIALIAGTGSSCYGRRSAFGNTFS